MISPDISSLVFWIKINISPFYLAKNSFNVSVRGTTYLKVS